MLTIVITRCSLKKVVWINHKIRWIPLVGQTSSSMMMHMIPMECTLVHGTQMYVTSSITIMDTLMINHPMLQYSLKPVRYFATCNRKLSAVWFFHFVVTCASSKRRQRWITDHAKFRLQYLMFCCDTAHIHLYILIRSSPLISSRLGVTLSIASTFWGFTLGNTHIRNQNDS